MTEESTSPKRKTTKRPKFAWTLIVLGGSGIIVSGGMLIWQLHSQPQPPKHVSAVQAAVAPSSKRPSAKTVAAYTVASDLPKFITIPAINVPQSRIIQLGLMANNQIAVPDNIYDTGWYNASAKPGQSTPGAMFIYGHVSSWTADGVFYNLKKLEPGDKVTITRGDNKKFVYQVVSSKVYSYKHVDMRAALSAVAAGAPGLNLMTCTGQVIKGTSEFNERLVVFTKLVS